MSALSRSMQKLLLACALCTGESRIAFAQSASKQATDFGRSPTPEEIAG